MTRTISNTMAGILEDLELDNETIVDMQRLSYLAQKHNVKTDPAVIALRLRKAGWLLPTPQRGVWEFSPAVMAGAFSRNDPLMPVIAYMKSHPETECFLCMQTAAWALGLADRLPTRRELAFINKFENQLADTCFSHNTRSKFCSFSLCSFSFRVNWLLLFLRML